MAGDLLNETMSVCANCEVDFPVSDPSERFCGECSEKLCIICKAEVVEPPAKVCEDCVESKAVCDRCGEPLKPGMICGDCYGGTERDPYVGESFSGGFAENH